MDFAIGGTAAVCAGFFTNPLEVVKTRMQLQGELKARGKHAVHYKNVLHAAYVIVKHDGVLNLQAGLGPALCFQLVLNSYRLGLYQTLLDKELITDEKGNLVFYKSVLGGGFAGGSGAFIASPFYLVKTHFQSAAAQEIAFGHQHRYTKTSTWSALGNIYKKHGVKGLFRGGTAAVPRAFVGSCSQLTSFTYTKELFRKYDICTDSALLGTFTASMIGGIFISVMMTPFDLVSTRMYNQGVDEHGKGLLYKNYGDCVIKIWKTEGVLGFYKGLGPSYFRLGPHTVLCLVFWDQFKLLYEKVIPKDDKVS